MRNAKVSYTPKEYTEDYTEICSASKLGRKEKSAKLVGMYRDSPDYM